MFFVSGVAEENRIFTWETAEDIRPDPAMLSLLQELCQEYPYPGRNVPLYLVNDYIPKNYPEWVAYRDVSFFFKYMMCTKPEVFPPPAPFLQRHATLVWQWRNTGVYNVTAFRVKVSAM